MIHKTRFFLTFLLIVLLCTVLTAQSGQKIFPVDSPVYKTIRKIYLLQGMAMPSSTGPWSASELRMMLEKIDPDDLSGTLLEEYSEALEEVLQNGTRGDTSINYSFGREVNVETYAHTNTDGPEIHDVNYTEDEDFNKIKLFSGRRNWSYDLTKISPVFAFQWETWVSNSFYGWFEFPLQNTFTTQEQIGDTYVSTNIPAFQNLSLNGQQIDMNFPYRAFVSFGGDSWSVEFGRDRLSWGLGKTGNLLMSDNFPYHNMLRYTAFSKKFKYTFLVTNYAHEQNYFYQHEMPVEDESDEETEDDAEEPPITDSNYADNIVDCPEVPSSGAGQTPSPEYVWYSMTRGDHNDVEGNEFYISHRIEGRFFDDKLAATLTESVMVQYDSNHIQWEALNPLNIYHNNYTASTSNSILGLELDWTPFRGFNCYGQFVLDELQLFGEDTSWPNGTGYLAGCTWATSVRNGILTLNLEGAYTEPYLYLRYGTWQSNTDPYGIDFIVADRIYSVDLYNRAVYEEFCLGYPYGPDACVGNFNCTWENTKLELNANYFFMAHGTHDFWTKWAMKSSFDDDYIRENYTTPTSSHMSSDNYRFDTYERTMVCYTNRITLGAAYKVRPNLKIFGQADGIIVENAFNDWNNGVTGDVQLVLGMKYTF
ncbi:MAG: hypothetical protein KBT02_05440 [Treponema sp.]|nr:hypothetical protein [Candidatus Treponema caballi]